MIVLMSGLDSASFAIRSASAFFSAIAVWFLAKRTFNDSLLANKTLKIKQKKSRVGSIILLSASSNHKILTRV